MGALSRALCTPDVMVFCGYWRERRTVLILSMPSLLFIKMYSLLLIWKLADLPMTNPINRGWEKTRLIVHLSPVVRIGYQLLTVHKLACCIFLLMTTTVLRGKASRLNIVPVRDLPAPPI